MTVTTLRLPKRHRPRGLEILHDDRDILVVNKEPGLLTMSFHKGQENTAERILTGYVRKGCARSKKRVFVVHRLDRESSGLLIFAKTFPVQQRLKDNWENTEKFYLAGVHGHLDSKSGMIESFLSEDEDQFVASTREAGKGKPAKTQYWVLKETRSLSMVKIKLITGRKNQIRVHFAEKGHPVVGDPKYGRKDKPYERLALHAKFIAFNHPHHGKRMIFNTAIPDFFKKIAGGLEESDWEKTI
jgi:tRNA pseudouridine32 synthase/23S rRNA pseudouridine746 synthase/23S rRNA pseudouridine1911/1915/1917 synthase